MINWMSRSFLIMGIQWMIGYPKKTPEDWEAGIFRDQIQPWEPTHQWLHGMLPARIKVNEPFYGHVGGYVCDLMEKGDPRPHPIVFELMYTGHQPLTTNKVFTCRNHLLFEGRIGRGCIKGRMSPFVKILNPHLLFSMIFPWYVHLFPWHFLEG